MDLLKHIFDEILVEREGYAFNVEVQHERLPLFCFHCQITGHSISTCTWMHPQKENEKVDHGKKPLFIEQAAPKKLLTKKSQPCVHVVEDDTSKLI